MNYGNGEKQVGSGSGAEWDTLDVIDPDVAMSDYERQREENIRKNNELLVQLGLNTVKHALESGPVRPQVSVTTHWADFTHGRHSVSREGYRCLGD